MKIRRVVVNIYQDGKQGGEYTYTFSYPETNISFKVSQTDSEAPDNCFVKIDGVSRETYGIFNTEANKKYSGVQRVEVYYGYDENLSLVFSGTIDRVSYLFNGGSQTLMMLVTKNTRKYNNNIKSISMSGNQTIKSAVDTICKTFDYQVSYGEGDFESISAGKVCSTGNIRKALSECLPDGFGFYANETTIFVYHKDRRVPNEATFWPQNGLLAFPTEDSKGEATTIKTTLVPNVESGMVIKIPVDEYWYSFIDTGVYKSYVVNSYSSEFQNGIGTTTFECEGGLEI